VKATDSGVCERCGVGPVGGYALAEPGVANQCKQPLIEIDNRGERLKGCLTCNLWSTVDAASDLVRVHDGMLCVLASPGLGVTLTASYLALGFATRQSSWPRSSSHPPWCLNISHRARLAPSKRLTKNAVIVIEYTKRAPTEAPGPVVKMLPFNKASAPEERKPPRPQRGSQLARGTVSTS
jgi:hypothetical protein